MGSGGRRPGAGRPRKSAQDEAVSGLKSRSKRSNLLVLPNATDKPEKGAVDEFSAPNDLSVEERNVWLELAPLATTAGTLTAASSYAFRVLCRNIVLERLLAKDRDAQGGSNHRGLIQRVEGGLDAFGLRPAGRPMPAPQKAEVPSNPLDRFLARKRG